MSYYIQNLSNPYQAFMPFGYLNSLFFVPNLNEYSMLNNFNRTQNFLDFQTKEPSFQPGVQTNIAETRQSSPQESSEVEQKIEAKNSMNRNKKKGRNVQKELESAKKNCQSNLVNQFLSYFSSYNNSSAMIIKALKKMILQQKLSDKWNLEQTAMFFCRQVSIVNSRKQRKYVNKSFLQNYFVEEKLQKYMPDIITNIKKYDKLTTAQFCQLFRRCCFNFFRTVSVSSVTSSAKLNYISRPQHIKRRRLITETLGKKC